MFQTLPTFGTSELSVAGVSDVERAEPPQNSFTDC